MATLLIRCGFWPVFAATVALNYFCSALLLLPIPILTAMLALNLWVWVIHAIFQLLLVGGALVAVFVAIGPTPRKRLHVAVWALYLIWFLASMSHLLYQILILL